MRNGTRGTVQVTGGELLKLISRARAFLAGKGLHQGDRCALLAQNSIRWVAMDLAIMAEGLIVVPLYARQAADELVAMMKDCAPSLICCGDAGIAGEHSANWPQAPELVLFETIFSAQQNDSSKRRAGSFRPGHHHLHVRHVGRGERRGSDRRECRPHARLHL